MRPTKLTNIRNAALRTNSKRGLRLLVLAGVVLIAAVLFLAYLWGDRSALSTANPLITFPNTAGDPIIVAAGDIAECGEEGAEATARLLDQIDGTVLTLGDNAYDTGTPEEYRDCYGPTWGRHKSRTRPVPGNHDYYEGGGPYYAYFGQLAGPKGKGYYSYNLGEWHLVALNSNIPASVGSEQERWLRSDLANNSELCTLAYWHHPVFSSGEHGNDTRMIAIWRALYEARADVVLNGHDHNYERFALQDPEGQAEPERGIREFVVGTGGGDLRDFRIVKTASEARDNDTYGVLTLILQPTGYRWEFIAAEDSHIRDVGEASCIR